jgi:hypothetical protein
LKQQRLETLRRLVTVTTDHYKNGEASLEDLLSAKRARDTAELELCASKNAKIAILERIVQEEAGRRSDQQLGREQTGIRIISAESKG